MTPEALARVLCDAYAPIAGADGWDGIEAFPIDKAAWLAVATAALAALTLAPTRPFHCPTCGAFPVDLTPAPAQGEQPDFSSGAQARITAQQEARRKKPTPPPPEPEGEEC